MSYSRKPCAYCGTTSVPREKGHVIPACMYPSDTDPQIQRPTVPECLNCKEIWQDAENQFRNIMVIAGDPNSAVTEQWKGPILRSFDKKSGHRWVRDLVAQMKPIETPEGIRHMVYPGNDPRVMLVVRKIVRGLCHYHNITTAVNERRVWADVLKCTIPPDLKLNMKWSHLGTPFFEYGFEVTNDASINVQSAWYLRFYEQREFIAMVSISESGFSPCNEA